LISSVSYETIALLEQKGLLMFVGYARVSTGEQTLDLQHDALRQAGCERTYSDKISGGKADRPELAKALDQVREGDTLIVWKLDRLGRSLPHLIETVTDLQQRGVGFRSITEAMDTTTNGGKLIFHIFGALAEFERGIIRERTNAGLAAARARGRLGGRPKKLNDGKAALVRKMYESKQHTGSEICDALRISRATLYRYVRPESK
jgi:DNA invertase Pin-like site-specific DNA recombinase